jgi:hypothetical protein
MITLQYDYDDYEYGYTYACTCTNNACARVTIFFFSHTHTHTLSYIHYLAFASHLLPYHTPMPPLLRLCAPSGTALWP